MFVIDRAIRTILGLAVLIIFGLFYPTWWCFLGLFPLMTGVSGFYPFQMLLVILGYKEDPNAYKKKGAKRNLAKNPSKQKLTQEEDGQKEFFKNSSKQKNGLLSKILTKKQKKDIFSDSPLFKN